MIYATEYDPNCEPEPACDNPECHDLLEQDLFGDWFCPTCTKKTGGTGMTNEEINAAIATECGWTQVEAVHRSGRRPGATYVGREFIPDYCADLNAMHEAEKVLTDNDWDLYCFELGYSLRGCASATARQRAEAFLRTLGKWKEVQK